MTDLARRAAEIMTRVRATKPLVHHITNFVVMNETANITLCAGALPVMAHARQEVEEMKNLPQVMATGAQGAAVIAAVAEAPDMFAATAELRRAWDSFLVERR